MKAKVSIKKKRDFKGTWMKILGYCKQYSAILVLSLIFAVGGTVLTLIGPDKISDLTNLIEQGFISGIDMAAVAKIGFLLIALYAISFIITSAEGWIMTTVTQRVSQNMRKDISAKINRLPMSYFHKTSSGDILSRVTNDVDTVAQSLNQSISTMVSAITLFIGSLIMMFVTNWIMAIAAIAATLIGFALMFLITGRSQKYFTRQQKHLGAINGHIEEIYAGHTVVKAYNGEKQSVEEFEKLNGELKNSAFKAQCLSGLMMPLMSFIGNLGYVAVCVVGAALAINGQIKFGVIVAFTMYVRYFTQPLSQMAQAAQSLQSATAAGERVFDFLGSNEMQNEDGKSATLGIAQGKVEFSHVKFGYEDSDKTVIRDFSAIAMPGQKVAIVGPTGAGKTTLVNLLMRFNEIQGGQILIDGVPIDGVRREEVRKQFCMVLQDTWLFEGSVRENLVYNTPDVSDEKLDEACKSVDRKSVV